MVTVDKTTKPKIFTESDHLLSDLKEELAGLKSRMNVIEEEQEKNRVLLNQLTIQEDLANELIANQKLDTEIHQENYHVIANVMRHLNSPVSSVVDNLAGIISNVDDSKTKETIRQCMDSASDVMHSFNEVADFCMDVSDAYTPQQDMVPLREYTKRIISEFQNDHPTNNLKSLRLQIDSNTPETCPIYTDAIKTCLLNILNELINATSEADIVLRISIENIEMKYGVQISDLTFHIELENPVDYSWSGSWVESIQDNRNRLLNSGFNILRTRDKLRKSGGHLEIIQHETRLKGFQFSLPLTY